MREWKNTVVNSKWRLAGIGALTVLAWLFLRLEYDDPPKLPAPTYPPSADARETQAVSARQSWTQSPVLAPEDRIPERLEDVAALRASQVVRCPPLGDIPILLVSDPTSKVGFSQRIVLRRDDEWLVEVPADPTAFLQLDFVTKQPRGAFDVAPAAGGVGRCLPRPLGPIETIVVEYPPGAGTLPGVVLGCGLSEVVSPGREARLSFPDRACLVRFATSTAGEWWGGPWTMVGSLPMTNGQRRLIVDRNRLRERWSPALAEPTSPQAVDAAFQDLTELLIVTGLELDEAGHRTSSHGFEP